MNESFQDISRASPRATITRRRFLRSLLAVWASTHVLPWHPMLAHASRTTDDRLSWLQSVTGEAEAVKRLGKAYIETHSTEQHADRLLSLIEASITDFTGWDGDRPEEPSHIGALVRQVVRDDYIHNRIVNLKGWILSRTEARLYALFAVLADA